MPLNNWISTSWPCCCHMLLRLLAQRDFSQSELVVSIPRSLCLTAEANSPQRPEERMAAALLREKSLGQKSQFRAPWYDIIQRCTKWDPWPVQYCNVLYIGDCWTLERRLWYNMGMMIEFPFVLLSTWRPWSSEDGFVVKSTDPQAPIIPHPTDFVGDPCSNT